MDINDIRKRRALINRQISKGFNDNFSQENISKAYDDEFNKTDFSTKERKSLSKKGEALPDGSFPIRNNQDLKDAIKSYGRAKDPERAKHWIKRRAKELKLEKLLPDDWKK